MRNIKIEMAILAVLIGVFLGRIPDTLAKRTGWNDFVNVMVDLRSELVGRYVTEPDGEKLLKGAIDGMLDTLNDPYTNYMPPKQLKDFNKQTRATFSGIGAQIGQENKQLTIVSPLDGSPAIKAGIRAGDIILEINGESAAGKSIQEAVDEITGPEGTEVAIKVRHTDGKEEIIKIIRQRIKIETVKGFSRDKDHHWDYIIDKNNKIGYIRLTQFSQPSAEEMVKAITKLQNDGMKGLILDLRYNPGGLLDAAIAISDMFLDKGTIVSTEGRNSPKRVANAEAQTLLPTNLPIVVLINEYSASASEILSGALKDNNRALIVGTRSYGKGSVQQLIGLQDGAGAIKLTTAYYYLPSGRNIHKRDGEPKWGVDPSDGFYESMTNEQMIKMNELRRDSDIVTDDNGNTPLDEITPDWIREKMADPQLALGLEALVTKINNGEYPNREGKSSVILAQLAEHEKLKKQREALNEALADLNDKINGLNKAMEKQGIKPETQPETKENKTDKTQTEKPETENKEPQPKKQQLKPKPE